MKSTHHYRGLSSIGICGLIAAVSIFTPPIARAQVGIDFLNLPPGAEIGDVLSRLYVYGVGVVAIAAMIMLVIGGVQYMVAGEKDPSSAKERIRNAIWGLILALTSYLILYTINPDLTKKVKLDPLKIDLVAPPTRTITVERFVCATRTSFGEYDSLEKCNQDCAPETCSPKAVQVAPPNSSALGFCAIVHQGNIPPDPCPKLTAEVCIQQGGTFSGGVDTIAFSRCVACNQRQAVGATCAP